MTANNQEELGNAVINPNDIITPNNNIENDSFYIQVKKNNEKDNNNENEQDLDKKSLDYSYHRLVIEHEDPNENELENGDMLLSKNFELAESHDCFKESQKSISKNTGILKRIPTITSNNKKSQSKTNCILKNIPTISSDYENTVFRSLSLHRDKSDEYKPEEIPRKLSARSIEDHKKFEENIDDLSARSIEDPEKFEENTDELSNRSITHDVKLDKKNSSHKIKGNYSILQIPDDVV